MPEPTRVEELVQILIDQLGPEIDQLKRLKLNTPISSAIALWNICKAVVLIIEEFAQSVGGIPGAEKREAAVEFINKHVNIPILPEFIEALVIGKVVDWAVAEFNNLYGRRWFQEIFQTAIALIRLVKTIFG